MKDALVLNGFMASGKTTVGREVARRQGCPLVDLDERVERRAERPVSQIFQERGEPGFRALETQVFDEVLAEPGRKVIALGGGALLDRGRRLEVLRRACVVSLNVSVGGVLERTQGDSSRPLLQVADPRLVVEGLMAARAVSYAEAHAVLDGERPVAAVAEDTLGVWSRDAVAVAAGLDSYAVDVGSGLVKSSLGRWFEGGASGALLVTDQNVDALHGATASATLGSLTRACKVVLEPGEEHKAVPALEKIWSAALEHGLDRGGRIVALGGGVVSDIAGFAAATWMRGVRWHGFPTTLLAMVDASVGGKTAIDLGPAKNAVGAFWQPSGVACDVELLVTEPERGYRSALSEVVKTALIGDVALLELLESRADDVLARDPEVVTEVVRRSVAVKAGVVSRDPREAGERAQLNLGHTLGHALEAHAGYGTLTHGEAVSLGLVAALGVGQRLGHTSPVLVGRVCALLERLGLPTDVADRPIVQASALVAHDKKRAGKKVRFVVVHEVGDVGVTPLTLEQVSEHARLLAGE